MFNHWPAAIGDALILALVAIGLWLVEIQVELRAVATLLIVIALGFKIYAGFWDARRARKLERRVRHIEEMAEEAEPHHRASPHER